MKKLLPLLVFLAIGGSVWAQAQRRPPAGFKKKAKQQQSSFLDKQWWIGLKVGPNLTKASPETRYTVLTPTNYALPLTDKEYDGFKKWGSQATLEVTFNYKGIGLSFQPTYRLSRFTYTNAFDWDNPGNAALDALILPLVRWGDHFRHLPGEGQGQKDGEQENTIVFHNMLFCVFCFPPWTCPICRLQSSGNSRSWRARLARVFLSRSISEVLEVVNNLLPKCINLFI